MEDVDLKLKKIRGFLTQKKEIIFAYLYGSIARQSDHKLSDIDIAIYVDKDNMPETGVFGYRSELIVELQSLVEKEVDFIVLNDIGLSLSHNILKDGKLLFCKSVEQRIDFHTDIMRKYLDQKQMYKVQNKYLNQRIKEERYGR